MQHTKMHHTSVSTFIDRLFDDLDGTVEAVVADGWPERMVRAGFELHRETWRVDELVAAVEAELAGFGGAQVLDGFVEDNAGTRLRLVCPESIVHIWPALPGAGLTPVLFGALLGVPQWIRPSRRGRHFAAHVAELWPADAPGLELLDSEDAWNFADVTVVSASDETVAEVCRQAPGIVSGYGHRVSFAVVVDGPSTNLVETAAKLATDTVMWHQQGCFSARAVLFSGSEERLQAFGEALGAEIAAKEDRLDTGELDQGELAGRAQARGVAAFTTSLWPNEQDEGLGWAQLAEGPFTGAQVATHVLSVHRVKSADGLADAIDVPSGHLQGAALDAPSAVRDEWEQALVEIGVTRVCAPGKLQAPPAGWLHDGRPNVLGWLRGVTSL
jgi:hypothetical protein